MAYRDRQAFYRRFREDFHLDRWESFAGKWLFLDERGRPRSQRPDTGVTRIKKLSDRLVDGGRTRLSRTRMFRTIQRAITNVESEIDERIKIRVLEKGRNIKLANSLAVSHLDIDLVRRLNRAHYYDRSTISKTPNEKLLLIHGINRASLDQIRAVCPRRQPKLQTTLFDPAA